MHYLPYAYFHLWLHGLQVPVADEGRLLVDTAYLQKYLVDFGNEKMEANWARTARLHHLFKDQLLSQQVRRELWQPYTVLHLFLLLCCSGNGD